MPQQPQPPAPSAAAADDGTVVFFHPDLGIGGAERLVVDAAVGLQQRGRRVVIFTNHCDPSHCFDECRDADGPGTLDVRVRGAWLIPRSLASRLTILCAVLRHLHLLLAVTLTRELPALKPRAFLVDQLSAGLPLLQYSYEDVPLLFYCHFPDLLLARGRDASLLKRLYRVPFDWLEEWTMGFAHAVAVNSEFTKGVVETTWPGLTGRVPTRVVHPCVDAAANEGELAGKGRGDILGDGSVIILSINRFERKKDIGLAIKAFAAIPETEREAVRLVLAGMNADNSSVTTTDLPPSGGYDPRVSENVEYHAELQHLAASLKLTHHTVAASQSTTLASQGQVLFLLSVPDALKAALLRSARLLVYTPSNEHFGIVPLEAMLARLPVLAANTGGPVETIRDPQTGWLRDPDDVPAWSAVMRAALAMPGADLASMGAEGAERARTLFGREQMAERLDAIVAEIVAMKRRPPLFNNLLNLLLLAVFFSLGLGIASTYKRFFRT
ncbi:Alpha-1,3/1,6-mannosyltransferase alg-2 [Tolypocladium paradoxum]|uniref:Alpha-1,3/1,6-mannosyltransferase ALG2 n=1 Tax=Tolypocladium paradoxum TaxID=94208 RepID=A0A2S4KQM8_9HYPO|nr:Alpha-1,3/1,6-mannosyltransferase alg-2 [Tolypocladium paradoxum]